MEIPRIVIAKYDRRWFYLSENKKELTMMLVGEEHELWINTDIIPENRIILKNKNKKNITELEILYETKNKILVRGLLSNNIWLVEKNIIIDVYTRSNINININYIKDEMDS